MKKIIIILLVSLLFNGCSSKSESKVVDLKDCSVTFPFDYNINSYKQDAVDKLSIKPTDLSNGIYHIYYDENVQDNNGNFRKFLSSYSNHIIKKIEHLELVEATETHLKVQVYFLIGEHFYISFVKYNDDMKNVIRECNESWK